MDENYLDNLLNEISLDSELDHKIEDELDSQLEAEKQKKKEADSPSKEETFDFGLDLDIGDSDEPFDFDFSEDQIDELDKLDNLADLDIGDLDFSDIDFDDVDITKLDDLKEDDFDDLLKEFEGDLEIDDFFDSDEKEDESKEAEEVPESKETEEYKEDVPENILETNDDLNEDSFDTNEFLDNLLEEAAEEEANQTSPITELPEEPEPLEESSSIEASDSIEESDDSEEIASLDDLIAEHTTSSISDSNEDNNDETEDNSDTSAGSASSGDDFEQLIENTGVLEQDDLDDLLSMLDMQEKEGALSPENNGSEDSLDTDLDISGVDGTSDTGEESAKAEKKKKGLAEILFGAPDEDDELSAEELEAIEAKKAAKKEKKQAAKEEKAQKKEEKKAQKAVDNDAKKKDSEEKKRVKAEKKAKQKAEAIAEAASEKKLNKPMVLFIFTIFLGGVLIFYVFTNDFNYKVAIEKAANYFASQRYHKAYDEIKGVEVKDPDKELKDRIYTVMYVERLYEAYETNISMNREEKALDSLLRGVSKYYEHYAEAEELGIVSDIEFSFSHIQEALEGRYGISVEQAIAINQLENWEYVEKIKEYANGATPIVNDVAPEDAILPEEEE